jgi:hypothetical protein
MTAADMLEVAAGMPAIRPVAVNYLAEMGLADTFPIHIGGRGNLPALVLHTDKREMFVQWNHTGNYYRHPEVNA